ncbi:sensor histidine kinase [Sutcliffiella horikoshii]|uniref:ATP-binding protein n=1 Tax=Sutcliffiella horikoshii TaxID=79883 RepID=UPI001F30CC4F|nr:sensor histidine kinase [Sutcliffiella horikoshii]MCG1020872.1 sensor histidine kinase [Sutcliffiella horikoshii]
MRLHIKPVRLQTKIIILIVTLLIGIIVVICGVFFYLEMNELKTNTGNRALQIAKTISFMPEVQEAMESDNPSEALQPLTLKIQQEIDAQFVVIGNTQGLRYTHPDIEKIGQKMVGGDNLRALEEGKAYISEATGSLGLSIRGKAPIISNDGTIIGVVSVGFLMENLKSRMEEKLAEISLIALLAINIGVVGGYLLARNIRKDILGLEPHEIATLYRERNAILESVKEGIIAVDSNGYVTMVNPSALDILELREEELLHKQITDIVPDTDIMEVARTRHPQENKEIYLFDKDVIVNRIPIMEKEIVVGVVSSFRDKTDMKKLLHTLVEVKKYSEELRAQTHEFTNKLYVISGMLELGRFQEALEWIQKEYKVNQERNDILFDRIKDEKLQVILLGKLAVASEKKKLLQLNEESSVQVIPSKIEFSSLVAIVGNLLDNALEAVEEVEDGMVSFFAIDYGNDIILEISDNGPGFPDGTIDLIFGKGYSTKQAVQPRGFGLAIVKKEVEQLGGTVEVQRTLENSTVFTVYLPKNNTYGGERNDKCSNSRR